MQNENVMAKSSINVVFDFGKITHKAKNTMRAHNVSPAYVDTKLGKETYEERDSNPHTMIARVRNI